MKSKSGVPIDDPKPELSGREVLGNVGEKKKSKQDDEPRFENLESLPGIFYGHVTVQDLLWIYDWMRNDIREGQ